MFKKYGIYTSEKQSAIHTTIQKFGVGTIFLILLIFFSLLCSTLILWKIITILKSRFIF